MTDTPHPIARALLQQLAELSRVVGELDDGSYAADPGSGLSGPIGAHVRHTLDHLTALLDGLSCGSIDYDSRARGTLVERRRAVAVSEIGRLAASLRRLDPATLERPIRVSVVVDPSGTRAEAMSTIGRELLFVANHTTHHEAIMALLMHARGHQTPVRFGVAPATPARATCARSA